MTTGIRFGTSGWRAVVADEFTVANIRLALAGIAATVKAQPEPQRVLPPRVSPPQEAKTASLGPGRWGPRCAPLKMVSAVGPCRTVHRWHGPSTPRQ